MVERLTHLQKAPDQKGVKQAATLTCRAVHCTKHKLPAAVEAATQQGQQTRQAALILWSHAKTRRLGRNKLFSGGKRQGFGWNVREVGWELQGSSDGGGRTGFGTPCTASMSVESVRCGVSHESAAK